MITKLQVQLVYGAHRPFVQHVWARTFSGTLPCAETLKIGGNTFDLVYSALDFSGGAGGALDLSYHAGVPNRECIESDAIAFSRLGFTREPT